MSKHVWISIALIAVFVLLGFFLVRSQREGAKFPFRFGLDLVGGVELVYRADTSGVADPDAAMESLKELIERRVNIFGVSEPIIQIEKAGIISGNQDNRLIVELPGYKNIEEAKKSLGETPTLEFRLEREDVAALSQEELAALTLSQIYVPTGITGRLLERSTLEFDPTTGLPVVTLKFNKEGEELFAQVTRENIGKTLAIFLDGELKQAPTIQSEISNGEAVITGYDATTAREVVRQLNFGALPVPITLLTENTIGSTLGEEALSTGVHAGIIGFVMLSAFLILWYRLPGLIASLALIMYIILSLTIFKLIPVTLTAAGVAGFVLSMGMAVDANVLIFERAKEELKKGQSVKAAFEEGFRRAWLSIRDSNISSIITAVILFWLGTSAVKGFALTLGVGVAVSMLTALTISRTFLFAVAPGSEISWEGRLKRFLFSNGFRFK